MPCLPLSFLSVSKSADSSPQICPQSAASAQSSAPFPKAGKPLFRHDIVQPYALLHQHESNDTFNQIQHLAA